MKKYTHIIWDFNGTVLNDVALGMDSVNRILAVRGLPAIPDIDAYREIFRLPIIEYYRALGFDFTREDYHDVLAPEWVAHYMEGEHLCEMNPGVRETLVCLADRGIPQVMLSASQREQLVGQLNRLGITGYFQEILGLGNIYANSKVALAHDWRAHHPQAEPLFLGDTNHDFEVAESIGADCILYTGGHQSKKRLSVHGKPLIDHITDVAAYFL